MVLSNKQTQMGNASDLYSGVTVSNPDGKAYRPDWGPDSPFSLHKGTYREEVILMGQLRFYFGLSPSETEEERGEIQLIIIDLLIKSSECCRDTKLFAVGFRTRNSSLLNTSQIP
jgi:hypothetical protein